jgi:hypothetical protein
MRRLPRPLPSRRLQRRRRTNLLTVRFAQIGTRREDVVDMPEERPIFITAIPQTEDAYDTTLACSAHGFLNDRMAAIRHEHIGGELTKQIFEQKQELLDFESLGS